VEEVGTAAGPCLRSALNARPNGRAGLHFGSGPQQRKELVTEAKERGHFYRAKNGDISKEA